jgi:UDP-2,3-diacylglucosamine hydrolase
MANKKIYFLSDFHLGAPDYSSSLEREKRIIRFLDEAKKDADEIFILGDIFDFWFEYKHVVPRGFVRLLGKLAELTDSGLPVHVLIGNHDMWIFDYLPKETGVVIHREPIRRTWNGIECYIGHGDGLGPGDHGYKFIKRVFRSRLCQWLFARLHPNFGMGMGHFWSGTSRKKSYENDRKFLGTENEWLAIYCRDMLKSEHFDIFVFGHRHLPMDIQLNDKSRYINLGDWISNFTYAVLEDDRFLLKKHEDKENLEDDPIYVGPSDQAVQ